MPERSKRLRVLAGPNGSGKSTIVKKIKSRYYCGYFVNADEIQLLLESKKVLNLSAEFGLDVSEEAFNHYLHKEGRSWVDKAGKDGLSINVSFFENNLRIVDGRQAGLYDAAIAADFIRYQLLVKENTFTFETVLSHPSKIDFLSQAISQGFKNYLYFVCTVDPAININRIAQRVKLGGHAVPDAKVIARYYSSLELLFSLIQQTHRTYLFDNSSEDAEISLVAEIENGVIFTPKTELMPWWVYHYVITPLFS